MDNFRKTLAYKICGYLFYVLVVIAIFFIIFTLSKGVTWPALTFIVLIIWILLHAPIIMVLLLVVFSIIALITKNKYTNAQYSIAADIGYNFMLFISIAYLLILPGIIQDKFKTKKNNDTNQEYLNNEYPTTVKNSCKFLNDNLPHIIKNLGADFTVGQLEKELSNNNSLSKEDTIYVINSIPSKLCDLNRKNCYIFLISKRKFGDCKFYFDQNGKIIPSNETLKFLNE